MIEVESKMTIVTWFGLEFRCYCHDNDNMLQHQSWRKWEECYWKSGVMVGRRESWCHLSGSDNGSFGKGFWRVMGILLKHAFSFHERRLGFKGYDEKLTLWPASDLYYI